MYISEIVVQQVEQAGRLKGIANITLSGMLAFHDIKIIKNEKDDYLFLGMPSKNLQNKFIDIIHPISSEVRDALSRLILSAFQYCLDHHHFSVKFCLKEPIPSSNLLSQTFEDFEAVEQSQMKPKIKEEPKQEKKEIKKVEEKPVIKEEVKVQIEPKEDTNSELKVEIYDVDFNKGMAFASLKIQGHNVYYEEIPVKYLKTNIDVNLPAGIKDHLTKGLTRKIVLSKIKEAFLEAIKGQEMNYYVADLTKDPRKNQYGRMYNAANTAFKFYPNTVLRLFNPESYVGRKNNVQLIMALQNNHIAAFEIDTLSFIDRFRYLTKSMIIDLFEGGYISHGSRNVHADKLTNILNRLEKYRLIDISIFYSSEDETSDKYISRGSFQIYSLGNNGNRLLSELGREHHYNPFDVYQNGDIVKNYLVANQWLIYWLNAYPDEVKDNYGPASVIRCVDYNNTSARVYGWVVCNGVTMIGEPVRRTYDFEKSSHDEFILEKLGRLIKICQFEGNLYTDKSYHPTDFAFMGKPIICYVCEDDEHMQEIMELVQPVLSQTPQQEVWFTTDLRVHNYEYENQRFQTLTNDGSKKYVDICQRLNVNKEREYQK